MEIYVAFLVATLGIYLTLRSNAEKRSRMTLQEAKETGLMEPASLHPVIDPAICIGCGTCVHACPEGEILGLLKGKAVLVSPSSCIGHGACKDACPPGAISLVFGTAKRGVDIPAVNADFETNVPGIYIAGELGGMGLIRNAVTQGRQAMDSIIATSSQSTDENIYDVIIVGSGPSGIAATLGAHEKNLNYLTLEQDSLGGTVSHFPRGKIVMTAPAVLPIVGKVKLTETTKEALLELWEGIVERTGIRIQYYEQVEKIEQADNSTFAVKTSKGEYQTRKVLLTIGRRGTPRKLDVKGEELPKVVYKLLDPEQYAQRNVLIVGGGDSALEAATSIAAEPGAKVTLSYRSDGFSRAKLKNRNKVDEAISNGTLDVMLKSTVSQISKDAIEIDTGDEKKWIDNDAVIVCAGGILPTKFLESMGIDVETKHGTA